MATKKISELVEKITLEDTDIVPAVDTQNDTTNKMTIGNLRGAIAGIEQFVAQDIIGGGEYRIKDNKMYRKKQTTPYVTWVDEDWEETTVKNELMKPKKYFLSEVPVGYWIDGSIIYRQTIKLDNITINSGRNQYAHGISNFKKCISFECITQNSGYQFPYFWNSSNDYTAINEVDGTYIYIKSSSTWGTENLYVTLFYTKLD